MLPADSFSQNVQVVGPTLLTMAGSDCINDVHYSTYYANSI